MWAVYQTPRIVVKVTMARILTNNCPKNRLPAMPFPAASQYDEPVAVAGETL
jgi:hypothetical protein